MAPYDFNAPDADVILCSSDRKELRVHRLILSLSSPVFQAMFALPQSTEPPQMPTVDLPDPSGVLEPFIQYLYPQPSPKVTDVSVWAAVYAIADKYNAEAVTELLREMLIPRFLETSPLRVYALASRWGFEEEAKIASRRTLTIDIFKNFPREDAELMGGGACQQLYLLHLNRREAAQALVGNLSPPVKLDPTCRISLRPWLTGEELCEEICKENYPSRCGPNCRHAARYMYPCFASLLKAISELPQTI